MRRAVAKAETVGAVETSAGTPSGEKAYRKIRVPANQPASASGWRFVCCFAALGVVGVALGLLLLARRLASESRDELHGLRMLLSEQDARLQRELAGHKEHFDHLLAERCDEKIEPMEQTLGDLEREVHGLEQVHVGGVEELKDRMTELEQALRDQLQVNEQLRAQLTALQAGVAPAAVGSASVHEEASGDDLEHPPKLYRLSGAGGHGVLLNGLYELDGSVNSRPRLQQKGGEAVIFYDLYWKVTHSDDSLGWYYYFPDSRDMALPPLGTWSVDAAYEGSASPAPLLQAEVSIDETQEQVFHGKAANRAWNSAETMSGVGSELEATHAVTECLSRWIKQYKVKTLLDIPCGDANWQGYIPGIEKVDYYGFDIAAEAVQSARIKNGRLSSMHFDILDLTSSVPMHGDLLIMRDFLQHLPLELGLQALQNAKAANIKYIAVSTYPGNKYTNEAVLSGDVFENNVQAAPFYFGEELERCDNYSPGSRHDVEFVKDAKLMLFNLEAWAVE